MEFKVYVANLGKYNEGCLVGEWLSLPATDEAIHAMFVRIGLGRMEDGQYVHGVQIDGVCYEEYAIHDYDIDIEGLAVGEYSNLRELNEQAEKLADLDDWQLKTLQAVLSHFGYGVDDTIDRLDDFSLYEGIDDDYDLGHYWIEESGCYDTSTLGNLSNYIDYERFGRDIALESNGGFTDFGFIEEL